MDSLTFLDPDDDDDPLALGGDTQGDEFKFSFTLPSQTQLNQVRQRNLEQIEQEQQSQKQFNNDKGKRQ